MSKSFQNKNVLSIAFAHYMHDVYTAFFAPLLSELIVKLGISNFMAGVLSFVQRAPSLFNPFIGMFIDRLQIRYFVIFTPAVSCITMSLFGASPFYIVAVILMLVTGINAALFHVPAPVLIKNFAGDRIGRGMSFYMVGGELARSTGPVVIAAAIAAWGLEGTFRLIPFGVAASVFLWIRFKDIRVTPRKKGQNMGAKYKKTLKKHLPFFILIGGIIFFRAFMKTAIVQFLPTYFRFSGQNLWFGSSSLSVFEIAGAVGTFFAGNLSDRFGRMNTLLVITLITPLTMLLFVFASGFWVFPILILMGFFMLASGPVILAFVMDKATEHQTFMNGIYMFITFVSGSVGALLNGAMGDWFGWVNTYKIDAFIALLAIPFVLYLKFSKKSAESRTS
jgi:FSR family fosmidomycin resistance protein-like MFS transporter